MSTTALRVAGLDGGTVEIEAARVSELASSLDGALVRPADAGYAEAVALWNADIKRRPALVVQAGSVADVVRAVQFAATHGAELSIRGGGHNIAGLALSEGGVTVDMSMRKRIEVDADQHRVRVEAGCLLGEVDHATQERGLATPLGFVSATGVAGLTVGGGFGYLTRRYGWTVDALEEVEIVTADGSVVRASRDENADLFWALRGGGGNFGVVTEFTFRLHDVGPKITGGLVAWPASEAEAVLDAYRRVTEIAPRELTLAVLRRNAPPAPWLPASAHGTPIVLLVVCHSGDPRQAAGDLEPLLSLGHPLANLVQVKEYAAQQSMLDATQPKGMSYYWKSEYLPGLSDGMLAAFQAPFEGLTAPANQIVLFHLAGALNEHAEDDGAVGNRDAAFACVVQSMWPPDSPAAESNREWVRGAWNDLKAFSTGGNYINFQTEDEPDQRMAESFRSNHARLMSLKRRYDPTNLFRVNRNIQPAQDDGA